MPCLEASDGTNLSYRDWGDGEPVVFVHGGQLGADMWEYQMVPLAERGLRCVAYDRRGCGGSDQPWRGYDYDTLADDLAAVLARLDLQGVTLVGHSMGCGDIARFLSRHGVHRVARVALVATTTPFLLKTGDNPSGIEAEAIDAMVAPLRADRPAATAAGAAPFFGGGAVGTVSREMMDWGVSLALRASPRATIAMTRTGFESDLRPDMAAFTVPTLVLHGIDDLTASLALCGRATAAAIAGSRLEVYATGHGLFITEKERLTRDLLAFATA
jgi:pimeloyl-ACP methyl ester carboxylesterase